MPALTAAELAAMRTTEEEYLPTTCVIQRMGTVSDGMGGYTESWPAVGTVNCDIYPIRQRTDREIISGGQIISLSRWIVTVPHGTDATMKDRLLIDNRTFEISFVPNDADHQTAVNIEVVAHNEEKRV